MRIYSFKIKFYLFFEVYLLKLFIYWIDSRQDSAAASGHNPAIQRPRVCHTEFKGNK